MKQVILSNIITSFCHSVPTYVYRFSHGQVIDNEIPKVANGRDSFRGKRGWPKGHHGWTNRWPTKARLALSLFWPGLE